VIRPNNPDIDVDELMLRVKREAARIRAALGDAADPGAHGSAQRSAVARHHAVLALLAEAERKNRVRREWPQRLRVMERTGPLGRALLRLWNYQFKEQREKDALIIAAVRRIADDAIAERGE
jgi:hypothetical protein